MQESSPLEGDLKAKNKQKKTTPKICFISIPAFVYQLVVEPTHLKNMLVKLGSSSPIFRGENNKSLKPPSSLSTCLCFVPEILGDLFFLSQIYPPWN